MRAVLEHHELALGYAVLERVGEPHGGDGIVPAESDLGRGGNFSEPGLRIVGDDCIGLTQERLQRLRRPPSDKGGELVDIVRLGGVELRREAPGKDALYD